MNRIIDRRDFLKQSAGGALAFSFSLPGAIRGSLVRTGAAKKIIVIGAGLAGLSAA